jgi:hypothetical protein
MSLHGGRHPPIGLAIEVRRDLASVPVTRRRHRDAGAVTSASALSPFRGPATEVGDRPI